MSVPAATIILRFRLPASLALCVGPGRWQPCVHQARVDVGDEGMVEIRGYNGLATEARRIVFDQLKRFLIAIAGGRDKLPIDDFAAYLYDESQSIDRFEHYAVVTGATVSATRAFHKPDLVA